ncbi:MAG: pantetheine-phosphate adenylyltransferase [Geminicoccaceae bacterium]
MTTTRRIGVYPGTFDPVHNGHIDIVRRATRVVDRLVLAVAANIGKDPLLTLDQRIELASFEAEALMTSDRANGCEILVRPFDVLLVDFAREVDATLLIRGLRAVSDFELEFQMASNNARLAPGIETVFLTASETNQFISSHFVKEIHRYGGDVSSFISANAKRALDRQRSRSG